MIEFAVHNTTTVVVSIPPVLILIVALLVYISRTIDTIILSVDVAKEFVAVVISCQEAGQSGTTNKSINI